MSSSLDGRTALVTGAGNGLRDDNRDAEALPIARQLQAEGYPSVHMALVQLRLRRGDVRQRGRRLR